MGLLLTHSRSKEVTQVSLKKSRPISRILSRITIHLDLQLLADSSDLPDSSVRATHYLLGLASGGVYIANC
ncbi:MAG: hypothetical protein RL130_1169, partial [Actinomycetota bacterium]